DQTAFHRPGQLAARLVEGAAVVTRRVVAQPGGLVGRRLALLLGQLPLALGFAGLARQGFLDGLENLLQLGLFALAFMQAAGAVAAGAFQAGQYLLALLAHLGQPRLALGQVLLLAGQGFAAGVLLALQVAQLLAGPGVFGQLFQAGAVQVFVVGQGAGETGGVFLVEQQLEGFGATALVDRPGLLADQSLLLAAGFIDFFFSAARGRRAASASRRLRVSVRGSPSSVRRLRCPACPTAP